MRYVFQQNNVLFSATVTHYKYSFQHNSKELFDFMNGFLSVKIRRKKIYGITLDMKYKVKRLLEYFTSYFSACPRTYFFYCCV